MKFQNPEINIDELPRAEESKLIPVDSRYYTVVTYNQVILWFVLFVATLIVIILNEELRTLTGALIALAIFGILCFLHFRLTYLSFKNKAYAIREHDLIYQTGWLNKSFHVIPYSRIQHCSVDAGVFERDLGISKLKVYTAGSDDSDIIIPGLVPENAASLREFILTKSLQG